MFASSRLYSAADAEADAEALEVSWPIEKIWAPHLGIVRQFWSLGPSLGGFTGNDLGRYLGHLIFGSIDQLQKCC